MSPHVKKHIIKNAFRLKGHTPETEEIVREAIAAHEVGNHRDYLHNSNAIHVTFSYEEPRPLRKPQARNQRVRIWDWLIKHEANKVFTVKAQIKDTTERSRRSYFGSMTREGLLSCMEVSTYYGLKAYFITPEQQQVLKEKSQHVVRRGRKRRH